MDPVYLDYNATTPVAPEVLEAMLPWLRGEHGNPSSAHAWGRRANEAVRRARAQVADAIGASADEIVFTSCGTEANNLAVRGVAARSERRCVVTTRVEHPAVIEPVRQLEREGFEARWLSPDSRGVIDPDGVSYDGAALVSVMLANNETGAIEPVGAVAERARAAGAVMHSDAAQALGKIDVDVGALGVDLLTLVGHKAYAPKGVAALFVRRGVELAPMMLGGGQERGLRPGTENVPYIVGFGEACALATQRLEGDARRYRALRERLFARLAAGAEVARNADPERSLPNTLSVRFANALGSAVLAAAPDVAASTGSACHEDGESPSAVLSAMGLAPADALGAVRLSLGRATTEAEVDRAADALVAAYEEVRPRT